MPPKPLVNSDKKQPSLFSFFRKSDAPATAPPIIAAATPSPTGHTAEKYAKTEAKQITKKTIDATPDARKVPSVTPSSQESAMIAKGKEDSKRVRHF